MLEVKLPRFHTSLLLSLSFSRSHCSHSLPFCFAADRLICSLEPSGRGGNDFLIFLLRRHSEGSPEAYDGGENGERWVMCAGMFGWKEHDCVCRLFFFFASHCVYTSVPPFEFKPGLKFSK